MFRIKHNIPTGVLIMRLSALGDVAMTIPVVYDACLTNPGINFFFLTKTFPAQLFVNAPKNLTVIGIDFNKYKGIRGLWHLFKNLRKEYDFDSVVDLHDVIRTKIIRFFARMSRLNVSYIDKGRKEKRALTKSDGKVLLPLPTTIMRYEDALWRVGVYCRHDFRSVFGEGRGAEAAFSKVVSGKEKGEKWIAVAPFAMYKGKTYPPELMQKVIDEFVGRRDVKIFLLGSGETEAERLDALAQQHENIINMARLKLGLASEIALLSYCDLMISMDSANMHIAALVDLPVISIWGATHPFAGFLGYERKMDDVVQLDMTCRPCSVFGNKPCLRGDYHCLNGISPSLIIEKASRYLS